jgi:hypothetical protein
MSSTVTADPYFANSTVVDFWYDRPALTDEVADDAPSCGNGEDFIDAFSGLSAFYDGVEIEGELNTFIQFKEPVLKEIKFSMDGKNYRFFVEEID